MKARAISFVMLFRRDSALQGRFHFFYFLEESPPCRADSISFLSFFLEESQLCRAGPGENKVAELEKNLVKRTVGIFDFMKT